MSLSRILNAPRSPPSHPHPRPAPEPSPPPDPHPRHHRASSSDLDDCPHVWRDTLSQYIADTHARQRELERYFEDQIALRNSDAARRSAHRYADKLAAVADSRQDRAQLLPSPAADQSFRPRPHDPKALHARPGSQPQPQSQSQSQSAQAAAAPPPPPPPEPLPLPSSLKRRRPEHDDPDDPDPDGDDAPTDSAPPPRKKPGRKPKLGHFSVTTTAPASDDASTRSTTPRKRPAATPAAGAAKRARSSVEPGTATPSSRLLDADADASFLGSNSVSVSAPGSPASGPLVLELDDDIPQLPKLSKLEGDDAVRMVQQIEEAQRKLWIHIARRDIPKVYKALSASMSAKQSQHKRISQLCAMNARRNSTRPLKVAKESQARAKKTMREMMLFWRKNEKDEREGRKRAEREALDRARQEEERRESTRQARKLEFLISQTELYSHFVGHKLRTDDAETGAGANGNGNGVAEDEATKPARDAPMALDVLGAELLAAREDGELKDLDFDDADHTNLHMHAKKKAQEAVLRARQKMRAFDTQAALDRKTNEALALAKAQGRAPAGDAEDEDGEDEKDDEEPTQAMAELDDNEELNFQNPSSLSDQLNIAQPKMLMTELKEYQLKGLNWLATLYEQGINGILADEMGLGKTVQSISLLAYLAEAHDIWGPFLVIAPASTLHNWQQELSRFVPQLKTLPYWGSVKDRTTLRKFWTKKSISYDKDAPFHVMVTSYHLVLQDQQYFQRIRWQYMILDEAQAIKNSTSARWKTLLSFHCRNRLLLTGTPIQNSMQELWALLHFIMPSLFDSHEEFSDWFSKDIENAAENRGANRFNEHQLKRLHMILKPFMLRRIKRHVQNELSEKIEIDIFCDLSPRQRRMYRKLRANVSVTELLQRANNMGDVDSAQALMNLVMQFRKVCNHPELFERAEVTSSFSFCRWARSGNLAREGDFLLCPYSARNPIEVVIPELFYKDGGLLDVPAERARKGWDTRWLHNLMNIWNPEWIHRSLLEDNSGFSVLRLLDISPSESRDIFTSSVLHRLLLGKVSETRLLHDGAIYLDPDFVANHTAPFAQLPSTPLNPFLEVADGLSALSDISNVAWKASNLSRPAMRWYSHPVLAPPIAMYCADRTFVERQAAIVDSPHETLALYGLPSHLRDDPTSYSHYNQLFPGLQPIGLAGASTVDQLPWSTTQVPEAKRLIYDSAKLARLDSLLQELKAGNHRVLIYFQMTRMIDLMEEYLVFRQYKYLRLDGSSKLEDRRDMVMDWQTRPDIFIFLLSTRAGGLGINLTAADTVVFYDHDWNPSNDAQAMDRAHRLGQTRQVTVYRLITKGTIDERIVQLARVKKEVQDVVVGNKQFNEANKPNEIAQLLLNDDELSSLKDVTDVPDPDVRKKNGFNNGPVQTPSSWSAMRDAWADEGDDFFGHSTVQRENNDSTADNDGNSQAPGPGGRGKRGRGRGSRGGRVERGTGRPRGRPRGSGKRGAAVAATAGHDALPKNL